MLKIGEFSKLGRVSVKTLRYYADLGLLKPAYVDRYSGYRYYMLEQLPRLNRILAMKELGFSLMEIEQLVREDLRAGELQRIMRLKHAELAQQVQAEQDRLERVALRLRQIELEGRLPRHEVLLKPIAACQVASIRDCIGSYRDLGQLFGELLSYVQQFGMAAAMAPPLAIYYDAEYREQDADVEVAVPLAGGQRLRSTARISIHTLPAIHAASLVYAGSYETLTGAYSSLWFWTQSHGYRAAGPNREVYLQGPGPGIEPARYVTEVQVPVQRLPADLSHVKETAKMEPRIVEKEAFTVVGIPFKGQISSGPYADGEHNNEIGQAWNELNARYAEIKHVTGPGIGLCFGMPNTEQPWYIAGMQVSRAEDVPAGMMPMTVPNQKYAVFECTLPAIGETYQYIMEQWQPRTGYQHADAPDFELYDEKWDMTNPQGSPLYIYWPIK